LWQFVGGYRKLAKVLTDVFSFFHNVSTYKDLTGIFLVVLMSQKVTKESRLWIVEARHFTH